MLRTAAALCSIALFVGTAHGQALINPTQPSAAPVASSMPYADLLQQGIRLIDCRYLRRAADTIGYVNEDSFDCTVSNSLREQRPQVVVTFPAAAAVAYPTSAAAHGQLQTALPPRAALWSTAIANSGGQVAVCIVNRRQEESGWGILLQIGIGVLRGLFFDPARQQERIFRPASGYNAAVVFDAQGTNENLILRQMIMTPRSAGSIQHPDCRFQAPETGAPAAQQPASPPSGG